MKASRKRARHALCNMIQSLGYTLNVNFDVRKKKINILLLKSLTWMIHIICNAERLMYPWKPRSRRLSPPRTRHFLIPISRHAIYTAVGLLQPGVQC